MSLRCTYIKIGTIQRRLAWPLRKDDTQIREAFQIFLRSRSNISSFPTKAVVSSRIPKPKAYDTGSSQAVPHPSTIPARRCLTSVIGRERVFSSWYGRRHLSVSCRCTTYFATLALCRQTTSVKSVDSVAATFLL